MGGENGRVRATGDPADFTPSLLGLPAHVFYFYVDVFSDGGSCITGGIFSCPTGDLNFLSVLSNLDVSIWPTLLYREADEMWLRREWSSDIAFAYWQVFVERFTCH